MVAAEWLPLYISFYSPTLTLLIPLLNHHLFWKMQKLLSKSSFVHCNPSNPPCVYCCLPSYYAISSPDAASSVENSPSPSHPSTLLQETTRTMMLPRRQPTRTSTKRKSLPSLISQAAVEASPSIHPFCHCLPRCY